MGTGKIKPMSNHFRQIKLMTENLQVAINKYKAKSTAKRYDEMIDAIKDYRVAWTMLEISYGRTSHDILQDERIIEHAKIYNEEKTKLVNSAIDSLDRHIAVSTYFLHRAAHQESEL